MIDLEGRPGVSAGRVSLAGDGWLDLGHWSGRQCEVTLSAWRRPAGGDWRPRVLG